jgi:hypothetical protein
MLGNCRLRARPIGRRAPAPPPPIWPACKPIRARICLERDRDYLPTAGRRPIRPGTRPSPIPGATAHAPRTASFADSIVRPRHHNRVGCSVSTVPATRCAHRAERLRRQNRTVPRARSQRVARGDS